MVSILISNHDIYVIFFLLSVYSETLLTKNMDMDDIPVYTDNNSVFICNCTLLCTIPENEIVQHKTHIDKENGLPSDDCDDVLLFHFNPIEWSF